MAYFDDSDVRLPTSRRPGMRRAATAQRCRPSLEGRPHLRLVSSRRRPVASYGMHPALPSTLAFAAVSAAALAVAAIIDVANAVARAATAVSDRLATVR